MSVRKPPSTEAASSLQQGQASPDLGRSLALLWGRWEAETRTGAKATVIAGQRACGDGVEKRSLITTPGGYKAIWDCLSWKSDDCRASHMCGFLLPGAADPAVVLSADRVDSMTRHHVGLMLGQLRRRWPNIKPTWSQCIAIIVMSKTKVFTTSCTHYHTNYSSQTIFFFGNPRLIYQAKLCFSQSRLLWGKHTENVAEELPLFA